MGKLNIAHHKSYHPYRRDNIERVRKDEEEARLKEAAAEGRVLLADAEARIDLLRSRAGVSSKPSKRQQEREEERLLGQRTSDAIERSQGHVNLFEDLEKQEMIISTKVKTPAAETDKGIPLAPSEKDLKPWYSEKGKGRMLDDMDNDMRIRDTNRKSNADPLTSINSQLASSSSRTSSSSRRDWKRPPSGSRTSDPDQPPSQVDARLSRESTERQRAKELIERKRREMAGSATPSTVRSGYGDVYNRVEVEEARKSKGRDRRR
ncbi:hypothetical protein BDM02DRAFT_3160512 [Thelephora ganbajun]|uniref:Uncharacterized protein n=1 Tax=Thelephora ganbajun TaxID=370292 RepID=A0ACB6ZSZ8_THEGA|nr:hypothetical protein BDM02DRAFT_3160512 [Thelephora ganbajun]